MGKPDRIRILEERSRLLRAIRDFFHKRQFVEVQTPLLSADTMVDPTIDPLRVTVAGCKDEFFLQTSPEFAMKRLLLEGMTKIFEITTAFRNSELGDLHNPEFTMLEWYRVGDTYDQGVDLLAQFGVELFPNLKVNNLTYHQVFQRKFGVNPHLTETSQLSELAKKAGIQMPDGEVDRDTTLQIMMSEQVEPDLERETLCIIRDWPATQSALARLRKTDAGYEVAERFELYLNGIELANGYHELSDPEEQFRRMQNNNEARKRSGLAELPVNSRLLESMKKSRFPDCCGVAVGFDRLLLVKLGLNKLSDVLAFDINRA